jgi:hypothetical protein
MNPHPIPDPNHVPTELPVLIAAYRTGSTGRQLHFVANLKYGVLDTVWHYENRGLFRSLRYFHASLLWGDNGFAKVFEVMERAGIDADQRAELLKLTAPVFGDCYLWRIRGDEQIPDTEWDCAPTVISVLIKAVRCRHGALYAVDARDTQACFTLLRCGNGHDGLTFHSALEYMIGSVWRVSNLYRPTKNPEAEVREAAIAAGYPVDEVDQLFTDRKLADWLS